MLKPGEGPEDERIGGWNTIHTLMPGEEMEQPNSTEIKAKVHDWVQEAVRDALNESGIERRSTDSLLSRSVSVVTLLSTILGLIVAMTIGFMQAAVRMDRVEGETLRSTEDRKAIHSEVASLRDSQTANAIDVNSKLQQIWIAVTKIDSKLDKK